MQEQRDPTLPVRNMIRSGSFWVGILCLTSIAHAQSIVQPGAPGQPGRLITPAQSEALARTKVVPADIAFMRHMVVHHGQAVEMSALIATRTQNRDVRLLGDRIAISQTSEIALMRDWLRRHAGEPAAEMPSSKQDEHAHHHAPTDHAQMDHAQMGHGPMAADPDKAVMQGMLTPRQMTALAAASGDMFDQLFLSGMIQHHQGAIDMVRDLEAVADTGEEPQLAEFMMSVLADQTAEIARMQTMLSATQQR